MAPAAKRRAVASLTAVSGSRVSRPPAATATTTWTVKAAAAPHQTGKGRW
jgi:hypothetical protein